MAGNGEEVDAASSSRLESVVISPNEHLDEYQHLKELGLDTRVASKLKEIYSSGKLLHSEFVGRALDVLKEFPGDGALSVLDQFIESDLERVSDRSAFLCTIMLTQKQGALNSASTEASEAGSVVAAVGETGEASLDMKPIDQETNKKSLELSTGYTLDITPGQRKYGGPPPNWTGPPPSNECQVFFGKIPRDVLEDELIQLLEEYGTIWEIRLMMDRLTNLNRGFAFVTFTTPDAAHVAVRQLNGVEMKDGRRLKVQISVPNLRLFVGHIPKFKGKDEIMKEFGKVTAGLVEVIVYSPPDDRRRNRGFCFLDYGTQKSASLAKRKLSAGRVRIFGWNIVVDWADRQVEPDAVTMSKVKILYVRNLTKELTEEGLKEAFQVHGPVYRVKKIKGYAFIHFEERNDAISAMDALQGQLLHGTTLDISLAKPPLDRRMKEEILKARQRRLRQHVVTRNGNSGTLTIIPHSSASPGYRPGAASRPVNFRGPAQVGPVSGRVFFHRDFEYENSSGGPYRGGFPDPRFNGGCYPYPGTGFYHDYPTRGGRGRRQKSPGGRSGAAVVQHLMTRAPPAMPRWSDFMEFPVLPRGGEEGRPAYGRGPICATADPTAFRTGSEEALRYRESVETSGDATLAASSGSAANYGRYPNCYGTRV